MPFWVRVNLGLWNNNVLANPATGVGGISLAPNAFQSMVPFAGVASGTVTANFGGSAFEHLVPMGFTPGWPKVGGGSAQAFDPTTLTGPGTLISGGLGLRSTGAFTGVRLASTEAHSTGKYYWEFTATLGLFTNSLCMGIYALGAGYAGFVSTAEFSGANANGGARYNSHAPLTSNSDVYANDVLQLANFDHCANGNVYSIAVQLEGPPPPPTTIADLADVYFTPTSGFVDLSAEATRRKFVSSTGCTVDLGDSGAAPLGLQPSVYFSAAPANPGSFATNLGSGGTFAAAGGSLTLAGSFPCCDISEVLLAQRPGVDPQIVLSYSDDGGVTWSTLQKPRSLGLLGQTLKRVRWLKMGQFRQRVIRLEITDPVRRNFIGFYVSTHEGME